MRLRGRLVAVVMGGSCLLTALASAQENTFYGTGAGNGTMTGVANTAVGNDALASNSDGAQNSSFGGLALYSNSTGSYNNASGFLALVSNTTGSSNSAFGAGALDFNLTGGSSSAFGAQALYSNQTGNNNTGIGSQALFNSTTGSNNIALGSGAGANSTTGNYSIFIGNQGASTDTNIIRIGDAHQTKTFIAGIWGRPSPSGVPVHVNVNGRLGTASSSARFKQDIAGLGAESEVLMRLRPVSFYYKPEFDETHTRQYGLVAEEVARVAPDLVVLDENGAPDAVRYAFVDAMLLNEVQKQRKTIDDLTERLRRLEALVDQRR